MATLVSFNRTLTTAGVIGVFDVVDTDIIRIIVEDANPANQIDIEVKLDKQSEWDTLTTLTGNGTKQVRLSTYESMRLRCTNFHGVRVKLLGSGFSDGC